MPWCTDEFMLGVEAFAKEAGIDDEQRQQFTALVISEMEDTIAQIKAASDMGMIEKSAQSAELPELWSLLMKAADLEKEAYIVEQSCTQSDGTKGTHVVKSHETDKVLGCFASKDKAQNWLRAANAAKSAEVDGSPSPANKE